MERKFIAFSSYNHRCCLTLQSVLQSFREQLSDKNYFSSELFRFSLKRVKWERWKSYFFVYFIYFGRAEVKTEIYRMLSTSIIKIFYHQFLSITSFKNINFIIMLSQLNCFYKSEAIFFNIMVLPWFAINSTILQNQILYL